MKVGEKIKAAREAKNLKQWELATKVKVSQEFISEVERGKKNPSEPVLELLKNNLAINPEWWETEEGEMFTHDGDGIHPAVISEDRDIYYGCPRDEEFEKNIERMRKYYYTAPSEDRKFYEDELRKATLNMADFKAEEGTRTMARRPPRKEPAHEIGKPEEKLRRAEGDTER